MAGNSMCGPSTPLKGLTEHFDRDNSLRQDIQSQRFPPTGFRREQTPAEREYQLHMGQQASLLQAESSLLDIGPTAQAGFSGFSPISRPGNTSAQGGLLGRNSHQQYPQPTPSNGALRSSQGLPAGQIDHVQAQLGALSFRQPFQGPTATPQPSFAYGAPQYPLNHNPSAQYPWAYSASQHLPPVSGVSSRQPEGQSLETVSTQPEADFDAAFELWAKEVGTSDVDSRSDNQTQRVRPILDHIHHSISQESQDVPSLAPAENIAPISDPAPETTGLDENTSSTSAQNPNLGDEEMARAAQKLVNAVSHDRSDRMQNSSFIELMRQLASRQTVLRDNNFVSVNAEDSNDTKEPNGGVQTTPI